MKLIDRYIFFKIISTFVFVVAILVSIIVVIDFTEKNDDFIQHNLGAADIISYYLAFIPFVANLITPITTFIAVVFVTAKLAGKVEIIAILSSGISFTRMMFPYFLAAIIIAVASFYLTGYIIPNSNKFRVAFEVEYFKKPFYFNERNVHIKEGPETYLYLESYNNQSDIGYKFTLETIAEGELTDKLMARRIKWDADSSHWTIFDWQLRSFDGFNEKVTMGSVLDTVLSITPSDFANQYRMNEALTIDELNAYISKLKNRGADDIAEYEIELYIRYMSPFAVIILTFIGLIVSARKVRGGSGVQIAAGFLIAFIFLIFFILSRSIAQAGTINPILAVWIPNIVFSIVGFVLYKTVPR
ncbi:MAG: LptF/LptG family permease [Cyclobacteriaceae bacterium]|nr:LptF/LptG family permease [Cyclobacteriaceae bacterium]MCH8516428.1 LptF/LptG family permease [Cyclobacteriaceae bacterium]